MYVARIGVTFLVGWDADGTPEYNFLRSFITVCVGAAGLGLIMPTSTYGGFAGAIVANDFGGMFGGFAIVVGLIFVGLFCLMAGMLLHIKWTHVRGLIKLFMRMIYTILGAFHLYRVKDVAEPEGCDDDGQEGDEKQDVVDTSQDNKKSKRGVGLLKKRETKKESVVGVERLLPRHDAVYQLPDPKLLEKSNFGKNIVTPELKRNAAAMEVHFAEYGVSGKVVGIRPGPVVTLYEFMPNSGTRMADVSKTVKDMTRAMATENIRIAHIPRTELIGVEMVNVNRQTVRYRGLVENTTFVESKYKIPLALGVDIG